MRYGRKSYEAQRTHRGVASYALSGNRHESFGSTRGGLFVAVKTKTMFELLMSIGYLSLIGTFLYLLIVQTLAFLAWWGPLGIIASFFLVPVSFLFPIIYRFIEGNWPVGVIKNEATGFLIFAITFLIAGIIQEENDKASKWGGIVFLLICSAVLILILIFLK